MACVRTCTKMMLVLVLVLVPVIRASRRCVPVLLVDVTMYLCSYQCYKYLDPWLCMFRVLIMFMASCFLV